MYVNRLLPNADISLLQTKFSFVSILENIYTKTLFFYIEMSSFNVKYKLDGLMAFAGNNLEDQQNILKSFIKTSIQNKQAFKHSLENANEAELSEIAHKMLPLYRLLEASDIVEILSDIEQNLFDTNDLRTLYMMCKEVLEQMDELINLLKKRLVE